MYVKESLKITLDSMGIENQKIIPIDINNNNTHQESKLHSSFLPLEWFDGGIDINKASLLSQNAEGIACIQKSTEPSDFCWCQVYIEHYNNVVNKWIVKDKENGVAYEVSRVYLMFIKEDVIKFAQRMQHAVQQRDDCESDLRFEKVLNELPLNAIPQPPPPPLAFLHNKIKAMFIRQKQRITMDEEKWIEFYQHEHTIVYQKALAAIQLIKFSNENTSNGAPQIELPRQAKEKINFKNRQEEWRRKLKNLTIQCKRELCSPERFKKSLKDINQIWLYCCPQSIKIMEFINNECTNVSRVSLFHLQTQPCNWNEFLHENNERLQLMSIFLQAQWIDKIVKEIHKQLANVGKGWYDMRNINTWWLFKMSKLHRMIELIKQKMEAAVIVSLKSSLKVFVNHLCDPCECLLNIPIDFKWNDDLTHSPFQSTKNSSPIFYMNLIIDDDKPTYSIYNLENGTIERDIIDMYEKRILTTHQIPQIDPYLITQLKFDVKNLKLASIGLLNEDVENQILHLRRCYRNCLIPLNEYARQYDKFFELKSLNVMQYISNVNDSASSARDIEIEIHNQLKLCDDIKISLPEEIIIGPFLIKVDDLKKSLIEKRMQMADALKELLLANASSKIYSIEFRYDEIIERLVEKPSTIEELDEIAKFISTVENQVQQLKSEMKTLTIDFNIMESLAIALPDEIFTAKWKVLMMPETIADQVNETRKQQEFDVERFRKKQANNEVTFLEKLNSMAKYVYAYTRHTNKYEVDDIANISTSIDKLMTELNVMRENGQVLNNRCQIFNQPEIDEGKCNELIEDLFPHHMFWTMTANFLSSKELWTEQPLSMLDIQSIEAEIKRYEEIVEESHTIALSDDEKMMEIKGKIFSAIKGGREFFDIVKDLRNLDYHEKYWEKLHERIGIAIKLTPTTTFSDLMMRGILKFSNILRELSIEANEEATCEREEENRRKNEEERRQQREEEIKRQKQLRRLARTDIFN